MPRTILLFLLCGIAFAHEEEIDSYLRSLARKSPYVHVADYHGHRNGRHVSITGIKVTGFGSLRREGEYYQTLLYSDNTIFSDITGELKASATVEITGRDRPFKKEVVATLKGQIINIIFQESSHGLQFDGIGDVRISGTVTIPGIPVSDHHVLRAFERVFADATRQAFDQLKSPTRALDITTEEEFTTTTIFPIYE